ncbi:hypothetical protein LXL04_027362 [Taraxacum kok-saghyz]
MMEEGRIPPKRIKFQEIVEEWKEEDRFSALPDCLLIKILSHLPSTIHAIRTVLRLHRQTLTQCRQLKLKRFQVTASYDTPYESQVSNWIRYAFVFISSCCAMEMVEEGRVPPKRIRFQAIVEEGKEDRFSALPDSLLIEILSRLPSTEYAIRTGALSKRCKHLWTLVPTLIFNHLAENPLWFDIVDKTLTQCRQLKLKRFEVDTSYDIRFQSQVNDWIRYAIRCNVEELNLSLWSNGLKAEFLLDQSFFDCSFFTDLVLRGCIFNPIGAISWKSLHKLCIFDSKLDEDLIGNILSGSPLLETLELDSCYGFRLLDITSKSVKKLVLNGYNDPEDEIDLLADVIFINAPNVLSLSIQGNLLLWNVLLLDVSSVVEAYLDYKKMGYWEINRKEEKEEMLKRFILKLCNVKVLRIGCFCDKVLSRLEAKGFEFPYEVS